MSRLRFRPDTPFLRAYFAAAAPLLPSFNAQDCSTLAWAAGQLGCRPAPDFLVALLQVRGGGGGHACLATS
jgi:hypothetical protein